MDQFDALIGGVPKDAATQQALIAALRRQNTIGQIGMASGDRVLGPLGKSLSSQAEGAGQDIGSLREREANASQALTFHQDQMAHEEAALKQQAQMNANTLAERKEYHDEVVENRKALAEAAAEKARLSGLKVIPPGDTKKLDALSEVLDKLDQARNSFKPEYAGTGFPGGRGLANTLAANIPGIATDNSKGALQWWQQYGRGFKLEELHNLYGARLTATERDLFDKYHLGENMNAQQIVSTLTNLEAELGKNYGNKLKALSASGSYHPDQIAEYQSRMTAPQQAASMAPVAPKGLAPADAQYMKKTPSPVAPQFQLGPQAPPLFSPNAGAPNMFSESM